MPRKKSTTEVVNEDSFKVAHLNLKFKPITNGQHNLENQIRKNTLTFCKGPAGTGKTFVSIAVALQLLKENPEINKICLVKSVSTLPDEEVGFLKGTLLEKMDPVMWSFIANFEKLIGEKVTNILKEKGIVEIKPIAYLRGVSLDNAIILVDETQNISVQNMRTILTRLGKNSKMIFLGDTQQIDIRNRKLSSLDFLFKHFTEVQDLGFVELTDEDIVRNPLIKRIEKKFRELDELDTVAYLGNGGNGNGNGTTTQKFSFFSKK